MRAAVVTRLGGPEVLQVVEVPDPVPGPGQVLVRIRAACVNPADVATRTGMVPGGPDTPPFLLGWDIAGEIVAIGDTVDDAAGEAANGAVGGVATDAVGNTANDDTDDAAGGFQVGQRVAGMIPWFLTRGAPGAYAELVAADPAWLAPVPDGLDLVTAATVPLNGLTAHQALDLLGLPTSADSTAATAPAASADSAAAAPAASAGSTLLVTGASGAVGGFAAKLAVRRGLRVLAVASHGDEAWVGKLGVAEVLPRTSDLAAVGPVPAVLDAVPVGEPAIAAVADGGVLVATRPVPVADPARRISQHVVLVRPDSGLLEALLRDVAAGLLRTRVAQTLPLAEAAQAHRLLEAGGLRGKVVLES